MAEIEHMGHVALSKRLINQFKPVQQSRHSAWVGNLKQRVPITSKSSKFKGVTQPYVVKLPKYVGARHYCLKIRQVPGTPGTRANSSPETTGAKSLLSILIYILWCGSLLWKFETTAREAFMHLLSCALTKKLLLGAKSFPDNLLRDIDNFYVFIFRFSSPRTFLVSKALKK